MLFDFSTFADIAQSTDCGTWPLLWCLEVFRTYFEAYEEKTGRAHPNIRREQMQNIMRLMPTIGGDLNEELTPDDYYDIIARYFSTNAVKSDYNINHFFSGRVREMRLYEERAEQRRELFGADN